MIAFAACVLFVLAGFDVTLGEVSSANLVAFGLALLALHLAYPIPFGRRAA